MPRDSGTDDRGHAGAVASGPRRAFSAVCCRSAAPSGGAPGSSSQGRRRWQQRCRWSQRPRPSKCRAGPSPRPFEPWSPPPTPSGGKAVLFSQIKECANVIETFVCHYAALGFHKLLLYLDDPGDIARDVLEESGWVDAGFVELTAVDDGLRGAWPALPSWGRVGSYAGMEVQSRQILNSEHALRRAKELGADWLLHVDSDELMCLPEPAPAFFSGLSARGCTMYTFNNVEGVPQAPNSTDVLRSVRVFRQNLGLIPRNPQAGQAFFSWQLRLGGWFISYENGKSAVNVRNALKCLSVCMWEVQPQLLPGKGKMPDGSTCTWFTNNRTLWDAAVKRRQEGRLHPDEEVPRFDECPEAVLLHFCVCDFASFWRKRWTQLGYLSASDQFRVRASSGATMSRFYRLQREGRQGEARGLYESAYVCNDAATLAAHTKAGVLLRARPERPTGASGPSWPPSRRPVPYAELAERAEARGAAFDAWALRGKAVEAQRDAGGGAALAAALMRQAQGAMAAGLAGSAVEDLVEAQRLGASPAATCGPLAAAQEALGRSAAALAEAERGLRAAREGGGAKPQPEALEELEALCRRLREAASQGGDTAAAACGRPLPLPTPAELQSYVLRAVRPDPKDSRLYRALLPVAMGWWQEVGGDEQKFANALGRAAITARGELRAVDSCVKPRPVVQIRELWDAHVGEMKETGALVADLQPMAPLWAAVRKACAAALGDRESVTVSNCQQEGDVLHEPWTVCAALVAEVFRSFGIGQISVLTEMRISRPRAGESPRGPEVDNGGLLPDNRREVSFRCFVPADGAEEGPPATLMLRTRDGEKALSFEVRAGRVFFWWSRQTFHQVLGGEGYFMMACWGVVPQKDDRQSNH